MFPSSVAWTKSAFTQVLTCFTFSFICWQKRLPLISLSSALKSLCSIKRHHNYNDVHFLTTLNRLFQSCSLLGHQSRSCNRQDWECLMFLIVEISENSEISPVTLQHLVVSHRKEWHQILMKATNPELFETFSSPGNKSSNEQSGL